MNNKKTQSIDLALGKNLRYLRIAGRISGAEIAKNIGISPQQLFKYELGQNRITLSHLLNIVNIIIKDKPRKKVVLDFSSFPYSVQYSLWIIGISCVEANENNN